MTRPLLPRGGQTVKITPTKPTSAVSDERERRGCLFPAKGGSPLEAADVIQACMYAAQR